MSSCLRLIEIAAGDDIAVALGDDLFHHFQVGGEQRPGRGDQQGY